MMALGIRSGDCILTTPVTFLADANCARYTGADIEFADIDQSTGLIDPSEIERVLAEDRAHRIKAIIPVDFAGQPADLPAIARMARGHGAAVVDDACHALGATYLYDNEPITLGSNEHSELTVFSFHPVKHVAMGEGGAVATNDDTLAERLRLYRNHGMQKEDLLQSDLALAADGRVNPWYYELQELGYNYRLTDIQSALGLSQLQRLDRSLMRRREIAEQYVSHFTKRFDEQELQVLTQVPGRMNAWHLFVVRIDFTAFGISRAQVMNDLRARGIGSQVHYIPIHLQPYYRKLYGFTSGMYPQAESYYEQALSLPMYPDLSDEDIEYVVASLEDILRGRP